jgi:hypothetical protein
MGRYSFHQKVQPTDIQVFFYFLEKFKHRFINSLFFDNFYLFSNLLINVFRELLDEDFNSTVTLTTNDDEKAIIKKIVFKKIF